MTVLNYDAMAILAKRSFFNTVAETKHLSVMQARGKIEGYTLWDKDNRMFYVNNENQSHVFPTKEDCLKYANAVEKTYGRSEQECALSM